MKLAELDLIDAAKAAAGNWQRFDSFVWFRNNDLDDADQWALIYTHHRDSGLLDQSNAAVIHEALQVFSEGDDPDVVFESHSHWAVGHIDGFSVRVFKEGEITAAFQRYHELAERKDEYPILDETDYSNREYEATLVNIDNAAWKLKRQFFLPQDWASQVYEWLSEHRCAEIENRDDQGGYPSEKALMEACLSLGFEQESRS